MVRAVLTITFWFSVISAASAYRDYTTPIHRVAINAPLDQCINLATDK